MLGTRGPDRGVRPRGRLRRAADHLLGGHRPDQVHRQGRLACGQAGRPGRGDAARASRRSCTRCRSRRCGGSARRRPSKLHKLGLFTVGDLAHTPVATLRRTFGPHAGRMLGELAWGRDPRRVVPQVPERSVGSQQTFAADSDRPEVVKRELLRMADRTASRMRKQGVVGRTVQISVRFADFSELTRSATMPTLTDVTAEIYAAAVELYDRLGLDRARIRRVGVRMQQLVDVHSAVPPAPAHRPRARLAGGRPGRRCGGVAFRPEGGATARPDQQEVAAPARPRSLSSCPIGFPIVPSQPRLRELRPHGTNGSAARRDPWGVASGPLG